MDPALALEVAALSRQKAMNDATALGDSDIQKFYSNSVIFLTGGSGFLGKQLIEKLFRSCQISKVYMLLRSKKGKDIQERLGETLKDPAFDALWQQQPNFSSKIVAIEGDIGEIRLGINNEDWKTLTEEVDVIYHVAATTKFDETLRLAALINVRGTREALLLGRACKKLRSYVHVSTSYTHATAARIGSEIHEKFYDAPVTPEIMISMAESMNPERLINLTTDLIKNWPNTYTFTKSIAEELVRTMSVGLPICIVRPGIVLCTYREPLPGWMDASCVYSATGELIEDTLNAKGAAISTPKSLYYNYAISTHRKWLYMILTFFLHLIPAYIADFVCQLIGKEKRFVKISKKVYSMCNVLSYFMINDWEFVDNNLRTLYSGLSKQDQAVFNFDIASINWTEYVLLWCIGMRKYLIKDGLKDTEYASKKQQYFRIAHYLIMTLYCYGIWKLLYLVFYVGSSLLSALIK